MAILLPNARAQMLLTTAEMGEADRRTIEAGTPEIALMEAAGRVAAQVIVERWTPRPSLVLCGPGNNGGDGYVIARLLAGQAWPIRVAAASPPRPGGAASHHAGLWEGLVEPLDPAALEGADLVIDALFGSGLDRPISGVSARMLAAAADRSVPVVAVDVPSGVSGDTGAVLGIALQAAVTVTFCRPKPGHVLLPGRDLCGEIVVRDIGIPDTIVDAIRPQRLINTPALWRSSLPRPQSTDYKYSRGSLLMRVGTEMPGAGLMAAATARRCGAGMVTAGGIGLSALSLAVDQPGMIVRDGRFEDLAQDDRYDTFLIGPGNLPDTNTRSAVEVALRSQRPTVLDAGALGCFGTDSEALRRAICGPVVITPHEGEFRRLFPDLGGGKIERAQAASRFLGAVVLLKGADTVIARPDALVLVNVNAPPELATAGSGDVLAGAIAGLVAQGMSVFDATAAAAWLHGAAAQSLGFGLIAEDLPIAICRCIQHLITKKSA